MLKINIWQIQVREEDGIDSPAWRAKFMGLERLERMGLEFNPAHYTNVWSGWTEGKTLDDVYYTFNMNHPADYRAHSLSVSDGVEVLEGTGVRAGFYFCDSWGWKRLENWHRAPEKKKRKGRETLAEKYVDAAPVGVAALSNFGGLAVLDILEGGDVVVAGWDFGSGYQKIRRHKVQYTTSGRAYVRKENRRFYMDEICRV